MSERIVTIQGRAGAPVELRIMAGKRLARLKNNPAILAAGAARVKLDPQHSLQTRKLDKRTGKYSAWKTIARAVRSSKKARGSSATRKKRKKNPFCPRTRETTSNPQRTQHRIKSEKLGGEYQAVKAAKNAYNDSLALYRHKYSTLTSSQLSTLKNFVQKFHNAIILKGYQKARNTEELKSLTREYRKWTKQKKNPQTRYKGTGKVKRVRTSGRLYTCSLCGAKVNNIFKHRWLKHRKEAEAGLKKARRKKARK